MKNPTSEQRVTLIEEWMARHPKAEPSATPELPIATIRRGFLGWSAVVPDPEGKLYAGDEITVLGQRTRIVDIISRSQGAATVRLMASMQKRIDREAARRQRAEIAGRRRQEVLTPVSTNYTRSQVAFSQDLRMAKYDRLHPAKGK